MENNIEQAVARVIKKEQEWQEKMNRKRSRYSLIFISALLVLLVSSAYGYKAIMIPDQKYEAAMALYESEDYQGAIEILESLDNYNNSRNMVMEAKYAMGKKLLSEKNLPDAKTTFESVIEYKDSSMMISQIEGLMLDEQYAYAVILFDEEQYDDALAAFQKMSGYKDSTTYINQIQNTYQQQFLDVLQDVLRKRESYTVYNTKSSFEDLLKIEEPVLTYQGVRFQDDRLTEQKDMYIEGVLLQMEALTYFDTNKRLFENKWQEGYFGRIQAIQEMYESGYQAIDKKAYGEIVLESLQNKISSSMAKAPISISEDGTNYVIAFSCINDTKKSFKDMELKCTWNGKYVTEESIKEWNSLQAISVQWMVPIGEVGNNNLTYEVELSCKK